MSDQHSLLRLNVGFIAHQPVGYSRDFIFDLPSIRFSADFLVTEFHSEVRMSRTQLGLLAQIRAQGLAVAECVRCLTEFQQPLQTYFTELYAFSTAPDLDETSLRLPESGFVDLAPLIREYLILEIPISPLCQPECKGLCPVCGENRNEVDCDHGPPDIDPRLAGLKSLLED